MRPAPLLLFLAACQPLPDWSDDELCGGEALLRAPLIPHPLELRRFSERRESSAPSFEEAPPWAEALRAALPGVPGAPALRVELASLADYAARCGGPDGSEEAYALAVRETAEGFEALIASAHPSGASRAAALLAEAGPRAMVARDRPGQALRGVLEGFYGTPWSFEERHEMLRFTWRARMNTLVWAPKGELLSGPLWRAPYSSELKVHVRELAREAAALEVTFCAELSPGHGLLYASEEERALLDAKLDDLVALGVRCLAIAFDDIARELRPEERARFAGGLAEAQAELLSRLLPALRARHPDVKLGIVPTDYSTDAMRRAPEDTARLARAIPREVFVGWTGAEIVAPVVTLADVELATSMWGRPVLMGDNYPVTDGDRARGRLQLGPVVAREPAAVRAVEGWLANTLTLPRASKLPLATIAELAWSPERYDPEDAWSRALGRVVVDAGVAPERRAELTAALRFFATHARASALEPGEGGDLERLGSAWLAGLPAPSPELRAYLEACVDAPRALAPLGALGEELTPWSAKLAAYGALGLAWMDRLERGEGSPEALVARARELEAAPVALSDDVFVRFFARASERELR